MEPWEDELLPDDDFSDEEEGAEDQIEETDLEMDEDGFTDWEDSSDGAPEDEKLEKALAEERTLELESELEQDENPRDYDAELEDEEEEAAPKKSDWCEKLWQRPCGAQRMRQEHWNNFRGLLRNGTGWTGTGNAGSVTTKICVAMFRWNIWQSLIQSLYRRG